MPENAKPIVVLTFLLGCLFSAHPAATAVPVRLSGLALGSGSFVSRGRGLGWAGDFPAELSTGGGESLYLPVIY